MDDSDEITSYRDLRVWQRSMDAADLVLTLTESEPLAKKYRLAGQWEAASTSVPANIAEGHELGTRRQYLAHLYYARGSLAETFTYLELFQKRSWVNTEEARRLWGMLIEVRKMLYKLISRLEEDSNDDSSSDTDGPET